MRKSKKVLSSGITVIDFATFLMSVPQEQIGNIIKEIPKQIAIPNDCKTPEEINKYLETLSGPVELSKECVGVICFSEKRLKKQFVDGINKSGIESKIVKRGAKRFIPTFEDALEEAAVDVLENYGIPTVCIKLSKTEYVVGTLDIDDIKIKVLTPLTGALLVLAPRKFRMFRIED